MPQAIRQITLLAENLSKNFDRKNIFKDISFSLSSGDSLAITGKNGSGKSTLIKILSALLTQTSGTLEFNIDNINIERSRYHNYIGLVSPYLNLYDEFTGYENLDFISSIRGNSRGKSRDNFRGNSGKNIINDILNKVGLYERRNDTLRIYSSGMKQRLKIAFAIMHSPLVLLLDEPTDNLDAEGIKIVDEIVSEYKADRILIVATNNEYEKSYCKTEIRLSDL